VTSDRITRRLDARRNDVYSLDLRSRPQRTIGQEVIARNDCVDRRNSPSKPSGTPATLQSTSVVGISKPDCVVKIKGKMPRSTTQHAKLPSRQQFPLKDYGVKLRRIPKPKAAE
jgi:hypothetical protein